MERPMRFLPVFFDLSSGAVALVGSGPAALNKLRLLRAAGANVRWYSSSADVAEEVLLASPPSGRLELSFADPLQADFSQFIAVVSAAGGALDEGVAARARARNVPVNVVDRPDLSTFVVPAVVDRGDVVVAIGTGGGSPGLARRVREWIGGGAAAPGGCPRLWPRGVREWIGAVPPARIGELASLMHRYRERFSAVRHK